MRSASGGFDECNQRAETESGQRSHIFTEGNEYHKALHVLPHLLRFVDCGKEAQIYESVPILRCDSMKPFFCLDCQVPVDLDRAGRCEHCGSDAVDVASREKPLPDTVTQVAIEALEALWRL